MISTILVAATPSQLHQHGSQPEVMERVPQKVLNWLHSVLIGVCLRFHDTQATRLTRTQEYFDVNRTFTDIAQTLENYTSLRPSTEVYSTNELPIACLC